MNVNSENESLLDALAPNKLRKAINKMNMCAGNMQTLTNSSAELETLFGEYSPMRVLSSRMDYLGLFKFHIVRMYENIRGNIIDPVSVDSVSAISAFSSETLKPNAGGARRSSLYRKLPNVPKTDEGNIAMNYVFDLCNTFVLIYIVGFYWKITDKDDIEASEPSLYYSIGGLSEFYTDFQNIYTEFVDVRRKSCQRDNNATIDSSTCFLESADNFMKRYMINISDRKDSVESVQYRLRAYVRTTSLEHIDAAMTSFHSLPEWIFPGYVRLLCCNICVWNITLLIL